MTEYKKYTLMLAEERKVVSKNNYSLDNSEELYRFGVEECKLHRCPNEYLIVGAINAKNELIGYQVSSVGNLSQTFVSTRNIFQFALLSNAASIFLIHNHPSGDPTPSIADINTTLRVKEAGALLEIQLVDHIIIGEEAYTSLREIGELYE